MANRIIGLETEFGCFVRDPALGSFDEVVERVKDYAFRPGGWGLMDRHSRDPYFEPAGAGGFLLNGGRLYVDAVGSHEEYATPECRSLVDLIRYDKAGQRLLVRILRELGWSDRASFHNNNVDHFGGHTFGCHENYSLNAEALHSGMELDALVPFLVTRQIYAGAGRVGGHRLTGDWRRMARDVQRHPADYVFLDKIYGVEPDPSVQFQLSQRADHILHVASGRVRFNRALINPKWDTRYDLSHSPRLHMLFGESNVLEYAAYLKVGTTALVLDLIEAGEAPSGLELADPIRTLRQVSRDPSWRWPVERQYGGTIPAVDLQRQYLRAAQRYLSGRDAETDRLLRDWEETLDALERDPPSLSGRLDWVTKRAIMELYIQSEGVSWDDEALQSLDLEYHHLDPERGLTGALTNQVRLTDEEAIERALREPPADTRAYGRGKVIRGFLAQHIRNYVVEWDSVSAGARHTLVFEDPFHNYAAETERFLSEL
ncbi:MAG TPA: peptidase [Candidatus Fraserbacteria bacterium]|nr:peptidase [Candidatus Fraserbacteria bacterium]